MNLHSLSVNKKIQVLIKSLDGAKKTNQALASCKNGDELVEILLGASTKLQLGLTRHDLTITPPIRDWIWFKDNDPIITVGDNKPRYSRSKEINNKNKPKANKQKFLNLF